MEGPEGTRLKLATALAILRHKPEGVSGEQYAKELAERFKRGQQAWQRRCRDAESEVLHLRQQLLLLRSQASNPGENLPADSQRTDYLLADSQPLFPTPSPSESRCTPNPNPSQPPSSQHQGSQPLAGHAHFLQTFINLHQTSQALSEQMSSDRFCEDVVKDSVVHCLFELSRGIGRSEYSWRLQQQCVRCVVTLMDSVKADLRHTLLDKVSDLCACLTDRVMDPDSIQANKSLSTKQHLVDLLGVFSTSIHTTPLLVRNLCDHIYRFSEHLRQVHRGEASIQPDKFCSSYFVICACERALKGPAGRQIDPTTRGYVKNKLEDSLLHVTDSFPLFAHAVWRLCIYVE